MAAYCIILLSLATAITIMPGAGSEWSVSVTRNYFSDTTKDNGTHFSALRTGSKNKELNFSDELLRKLLQQRKAARFLLGQSRKKQNIEAWYFPGSSDKNALVIGGVHGTELSGIEVAKTLIEKLAGGIQSHYHVIIIPCLFADNASVARNNPIEIGSVANIGRYSFSTAADPNRQMPSPGEPFDESETIDHLGREIEKENRLLLKLINVFKPERIASIHGIRDLKYAGIYADPRTDDRGCALGFESDSSLAIEMAHSVYQNNGFVPGNMLHIKPTALYYKDPSPVLKGDFQPRNFSGSSLPDNRGAGISLGTWGSTAISKAKDPSMNRDAMRIITIEFPGYKRPGDYKNSKHQKWIREQVQLYASSIGNIFLGQYPIDDRGIDGIARFLTIR
ncbi:MAG TPA: hypothetical protein VGQ53_00725 [Chitinophagaceae bacterium]|jgi:hypothetical protein|nr:hypothetical protein [Chitinophagaceae bacterium]